MFGVNYNFVYLNIINSSNVTCWNGVRILSVAITLLLNYNAKSDVLSLAYFCTGSDNIILIFPAPTIPF